MFNKGYIPWNKGKHISEETKLKISQIAKEKGFGKWMLGRKLSKDIRLKMSKSHKGKIPWSRGKRLSDITKIKMSIARKKSIIKGCNNPHFTKGYKWTKIELERRKKSQGGINHPRWKGGISRTRAYQKLYSGLNRQKRLNIGKLSLQTVQQVYEDNIKRFGTLTCYLCLKPIEFGKDSLDHKIPISRGGNHDFVNLAITHWVCNNKKNAKTPEEYKNYVSKSF